MKETAFPRVWMISSEETAGISTLQRQRRAKGKVIDKPFCLVSFENDTYSLFPAIFFK